MGMSKHFKVLGKAVAFYSCRVQVPFRFHEYLTEMLCRRV